MTTPVSAHLEAELRDYTRQHGLVYWLDKEGLYTGLTDELALRHAGGTFPFPVVGLRGSYLEAMLDLERLFDTVDPTPLVLHLPGHNEESVRSTPLLELVRPGRRFRKGLETLVVEAAAGRVRPEAIREFLDAGAVDLAAADIWLAAQLQAPTGGLAGQLEAMAPAALLDDLLGQGIVSGRLNDPSDLAAVWAWLEIRLGLDADWRKRAGDGGRAQDVAFAAAGWVLCVEYVHDLARPPRADLLKRLARLPGAVAGACTELAAHLRERHPAFYGRTADEVEPWLDEEISGATPEDLGRIDTFRFEEDVVLRAALAGLEQERWEQVRAWATARLDGASFWLRDPARRAAWELLLAGVGLGTAISAAGPNLGATESHEGALARYESGGAAVDRAHRRLEQRRSSLLYPSIPYFSELRGRLDGLRQIYRTWADDWARDFSALCGSLGFLPPDHLQQRTLFDQVVRPWAKEPGVTAFFMIDALRFEMAQELAEALDGQAATAVHLKSRLAELPSLTAVGMNVLAPVVTSGRLRPLLKGSKFRGFQASEFQVTSPDSRQRAMQARVGGSTCPLWNLDDVLARDAESLKRGVAQADLVIIHGTEIDDAGEKGAGYAVFERSLQNLRAAWKLLRDAGVRRFVFTSDHGFLLLDDQTRRMVPHGRKIDPKRRHVVYPDAIHPTGQVSVPLESLGYEGVEGHLVMPADTAMYDIGKTSASFVHGGNSLQERVIPVLTVLHRTSAGGGTIRYALRAEARDGIAGLHCIEGQLGVVAQEGLPFGGTRELELALRAVDARDVVVEVADVRGVARRTSSGFVAEVNGTFEVFFRLSGPADQRVRVELFHPTGAEDVESGQTTQRFVVAGAAVATTDVAPERGWLQELPEGGVRRLFEHLASHGSINEGEATQLLGGPRQLRRFSMRFETHASVAPFGVRIEFGAAGKRFVREGDGE